VKKVINFLIRRGKEDNTELVLYYFDKTEEVFAFDMTLEDAAEFFGSVINADCTVEYVKPCDD